MQRSEMMTDDLPVLNLRDQFDLLLELMPIVGSFLARLNGLREHWKKSAVVANLVFFIVFFLLVAVTQKIFFMALMISAMATLIFDAILVSIAYYFIEPIVSSIRRDLQDPDKQEIIFFGIAGLKKIPNSFLAVLLLGEKRDCTKILPEGWSVFFRGVMDCIPVNKKIINLDFKVAVISKDNAGFVLKCSISIQVDKNRMCIFLDAGGIASGERITKENEENGIADILLDAVQREITIQCRKIWMEAVLDLDPSIASSAVKAITGEANPDLNMLTHPEGYPVEDLGIKIRRVIVSTPTPDVKIKESLEKVAIEKIEAIFEKQNLDTKIAQIKQLQEELGHQLDPRELFFILTEQELVAKDKNITPGLNALMGSIAHMIDHGANADSILSFIKQIVGK